MKYRLVCKKCGKEIQDFAQWLQQDQLCECGSNYVEAEYNTDYTQLKSLISSTPENFWHYFDYLPLSSKENAISCQEGTVPIEEWDFLNRYAKENYGIDCKVMVCRNDLNGGTNTFKDVAAALAASIFKENGVKEYCLASTGNTATAYSKYLSIGGTKFTVFTPNCVNEDTVEEIKSHNQNIVISEGDYAQAKKEAVEHHKRNNVLISMGNIDPIRVEAKKTMVFEFLRQLGKMPDVYLQAVSGGTGPIAIEKGVREISAYYPEATLPKMLLVQQDTCDPMVQGWEEASRKGFPEGYEKEYPVIENPQTCVSILSTGNPGMFPIVAPIVKKSGGNFLRVKEADLVDYARLIKRERNIDLGPASIVCFAGFFEALRKQEIANGQLVLINTGEGAARARDFKKRCQLNQ